MGGSSSYGGFTPPASMAKYHQRGITPHGSYFLPPIGDTPLK